ncbi:MAG: hypothetical protein AAB922_00795, partial [Patescibacteria group bacterium]
MKENIRSNPFYRSGERKMIMGKIEFENIVEAVGKIIKVGSPRSIHFEMSLSQAKRIYRMGKFSYTHMGFSNIE